MKAYLLTEPGRLELRELPRPEPGPGEVVLRVRAGLTCGTDLKTIDRGHPIFPMPTRLGHEFSGEVAAAGRGVKAVREGDAVLAVPSAPCRRCYLCRREQENLCPAIREHYVLGGFGEYLLLPEAVVRTNLYPKPPALSFIEGALLEPLACVVHGLARVRLRPDDTVLLLGAGAIALLHALVLRARGVRRILVAARNPRRAAHCRALGLEVIAHAAAEAGESVRERTGGRGADVVVECTGRVDVWECAPGLARRGGQVVLFGGCPSGSAVRFDTHRLHYDEVAVSSPFHFTPRDVREAYELLAGGRVAAGRIVAASVPLEALPEALARQRRGDGPKYAVIPVGVAPA